MTYCKILFYIRQLIFHRVISSLDLLLLQIIFTLGSDSNSELMLSKMMVNKTADTIPVNCVLQLTFIWTMLRDIDAVEGTLLKKDPTTLEMP